MSREIFNSLNTAMGNFIGQRAQVSKQIEAARASIADLDPELRAACNLLIEKLVHPQSVSQTITSVFQATKLKDTLDEMDAVIAAMQVAQEDMKGLTRQMEINAEVTNSPHRSAAPGEISSSPAAASNGNQGLTSGSPENVQETASHRETHQIA